jgi:hypothetical protein
VREDDPVEGAFAMLIRTMFPVPDFGLVRKSILSVLIGLMGGGVAVLAQQPADANASANATAPAAAVPVSDAPQTATAAPATPPDSAAAVTPPVSVPADATPAATASGTPADPASATTAAPATPQDSAAAATPPASTPADATPATTAPGAPADTTSAVTATPSAGASADATTPADPADPIAAAQSKILAGFVPTVEPIPVKIGADGEVVDEQMDKETAKKVKKLRDKFKGKQKLPKQTPMDIVQGTLTVDGWTGKARMNYDIADLKYLYVWAPGVGTVVISDGWFEAGEIQLHAFAGNMLTVTANGHTIQITSEKRMLGKKQTSAFVYVDPSYTVASNFPVMGYGSTDHQPYAWPGAKNVKVVAKNTAVIPPPLPKDLRPTLAVAGCAPVGSKAALGQTPCTEAVEAARRKAIAAAAAAAKQNSTTATTQPTLQTRPATP